jgi:hypothetical protein
MNNIKTNAKSAESNHGGQAVSQRLCQTSVSLFNLFALYLSILTLITCLTVCLAAANAHAQDDPSQDSVHAPAITTGSWSLESTTCASSPRFLLSAVGLPDFQAFDWAKTSTLHSGGNQPAEPIDDYSTNLTAGASPSSVSFLALIQTRYVRWESSLADTRTPTSVNGAMVYPLLQINYANGSVPVALYNSPLLGSDTRW